MSRFTLTFLVAVVVLGVSSGRVAFGLLDCSIMSVAEQESAFGGAYVKGECLSGVPGTECNDPDTFCSGADQYCVEQKDTVLCRTVRDNKNPTRCIPKEFVSTECENNGEPILCDEEFLCKCKKPAAVWICDYTSQQPLSHDVARCHLQL